MKNAKNSEPCKPLRCTHTHTHTHTCISREIKRVANGATLYCVKDRVFIVLYEGKNMVLEIACFSRCRKLELMRKFYTKLKSDRQYEAINQGGVE